MEGRLEKFKELLGECVEMRNLTPHEIKIVDSSTDGVDVIYLRGDNPLRIQESMIRIGDYAGTVIMEKIFTEIKLPEYERGVINIVSLSVAQFVKKHYGNRVDFVCPGELLRDDKGQIVGCKNLAFI